ncbi:hypothetical protein ACFXPN_30415, partial [Streptomyces griseorubiginosus]|uniref:hypothetical protein n=1 Tax=Streptomyces griseorubiginosus TaxID=67304 RepID=UPI0036B9F091
HNDQEARACSAMHPNRSQPDQPHDPGTCNRPAPETKGYYLIGLRPVYPLEYDVVDLVARAKDVSPLMRLQEEE